jgi:hypothetical protein
MFDGLNFNNPDLQTAVDAIEEHVDELKPTLTAISQDIAKLERWLLDKEVCVPVSVFSHSERQFLDGDEGDFIEFRQYLDWNQHRDKWRLTIRTEQAAGCLAVSQTSYVTHEDGFIDPVDASAEMLLRVNRVLPQFVHQVGEAIRPAPLVVQPHSVTSDDDYTVVELGMSEGE